MSKAPIVKGSKQLKMIVVPYRPWRKTVACLGILLLVAATGGGFYFYGYSEGVFINGDARQERDELIVQVDVMSSQLNILQQELTNSEQANAVDRQALEEVQGTIINLRETIAQLEEDVLYYKEIMSPENTETGLMIGQLDLLQTDLQNRIRYRLELRQAGNNDNLVSGYVNVNILGTRDRQEISMPLRSLAVEEDQLDIKLQFRYFQNIQGELILPDGFLPLGVQILAVDEGNNGKTIQKSFAWLVE
ncbi:MAG: hypothetical protein P8J44_02815 [Gammaproteobacteria bacterium]|nr:hypothetical protein [Gammaproteobacteria bacterium]